MRDKKPSLPILLVDDEEQACRNYTMALETVSINNILDCQDSREVMPILSRQEVGVIVLDLLMPHISGKELLPRIVRDFPDIPVIMLTAVDEVETAVECMHLGAFDYMTKPVEKERLVSGIKRAIDMRELKQMNASLREHFFSEELEHPDVFSEIVTNNRAMRAIFHYVESIAGTSRPVLLTGETGVGKELIARAIHSLSGRKGSLVSVNAGGLDDNVFSDTLFGHKKGAFTGADNTRCGLVEQAAGGTLFLDEIGDLEAASQVKLLRLLQEGEYYPLGSDIKKLSDARIVVATNCDIQKLIDGGGFRKDLYYRLGDHQVKIPPLCKRLDDLPVLVEHFINEVSDELGKKKPAYPEELIGLLSSYHFPGNIRELQSMIFDALSMHKKGKLSLNSFREAIFGAGGDSGKTGPSFAEPHMTSNGASKLDISKLFDGPFPTIREVEELLIGKAMKIAGGNQSIASQMLGLSRPTLSKRLKRSNPTQDQ